jgi:succinate dehydrogenase / fumarate reductase, cytochrome b subunit
MNKKRPINLDLTTIHFPITAIASILHRISGIILFLYAPFLIWLLDQSLSSSTHFLNLQSNLSEPFMKWLIWLFLASIFYHLLAGIRHILMDFHIGESLRTGRLGAKLTIGISVVLTLFAGVWLWW